MLPKQNRFIRKDFQNIYKGSPRARSGPFQLIYHETGFQSARFGFVIPLSVSKKAVRRNLLRRRLHAIIQKAVLPRIVGYDCVIQAYPGAERLDFKEIERCVVEMIRKIPNLKFPRFGHRKM